MAKSRPRKKKTKPSRKKAKPKRKKAKSSRKKPKPPARTKAAAESAPTIVRPRPEIVGFNEAPTVYSNYVLVSRTQHDFVLSFCLTEPYMDFLTDRYERDKDGSLIINAKDETNIRIPDKLVVSLVDALKKVYNASHPDDPIP
ncbi:MAG: hypothetical protein E3J72_17015 [Planctomycetota bacterium]|nr:MAG: hypothetical protein E3J72_17015 [Planctomycetota bacterium]